MKKELLQTMLHYMKQFLLATFYGARQCMFQLLCWEVFELIVNLMGFYLYSDHPAAFTVRWSVYLCVIVFTMLFHWMSMLMPQKKISTRFLIPYILCVIGWISGLVIIGVVVPFICLLFFLLENYLKNALTPRPKSFLVIKVVCNTFCGIILAASVYFIFSLYY